MTAFGAHAGLPRGERGGVDARLPGRLRPAVGIKGAAPPGTVEKAQSAPQVRISVSPERRRKVSGQIGLAEILALVEQRHPIILRGGI